ncbi:EAL domain-containing protein [Persephonella sp.]
MDYRIKERILKNLLVEITKKYDYLINEYRAGGIQIKDKLMYDYITGLLNREGFKNKIKILSQLSRKENKNIAVITFDLDNFKIINTSYGHDIGDMFLKGIADILNKHSRSNWITARIGGDEFGIAIYGIDYEDLLPEVERVKEIIENYRLKVGDSTINTTASIGVSVFTPDTEENILSVLNKAEVGIYQSKTHGKSITTFSTEEYQNRFIQLENRKRIITHALENKNSVLPYIQPIVSLSDRKIVGGELLLRIKYRGEILPASEFIEAAVTFGLLKELERIQLEQVLNNRGIKKLEGRFLFINRHIKPDSLYEIKALIDRLSEFRKSIADIKFVIEITENSFVENFSLLEELITYARENDILFALDDFGAGIASFGYVSKLPVDIIKIDGSIINKCTADKKHQAIMKAISVLTKELGIKTVAEFIDSPEKLERCCEFDIDYGQGFYFGRPVDIEQFLQKL